MKKAYIFPGQSSQYVGMALDLYSSFDIAKKRFEQADEILGIDLKNICFNGPEVELKKTFITQPAIFVHSVIVAELLNEKGYSPVAVAGHSLGEYSAMVSAGVLNFENGLKLVKERSRLMYEAGINKPGTMGAVIGLEVDVVNEICNSLQNEGIVQAANFNSPGQIVISGEIKTVLKALEAAKEKGARMAMQLVVSGAFHSPLMLEAQKGLEEVLNSTPFNDASIPVYTNVTSKAETNAAKLKALLLQQLTKPVRWEEIIINMINTGNSKFIEVGPGSVLKGLLKRIDKEADCQICGTVEQIENFGE